QLLATDADETVAAAAYAAVAVIDLDVVPMIEGFADLLGRHGIGFAQVAQRGVGKHDPPAEGVVGTVAFNDGDFVTWVAELHHQPEIQAGGPAAYTNFFHASSECLPMKRRKLGCRPPPQNEFSLGLNYIVKKRTAQ